MVQTMFDSIPLRSLHPGQMGQVKEITGDPHAVHRLQELGIRHGTTVEMVRSGSPCIIRMSGHKLCFRQNGDLDVFVRPASAV